MILAWLKATVDYAAGQTHDEKLALKAKDEISGSVAVVVSQDPCKGGGGRLSERRAEFSPVERNTQRQFGAANDPN